MVPAVEDTNIKHIDEILRHLLDITDLQNNFKMFRVWANYEVLMS